MLSIVYGKHFALTPFPGIMAFEVCMANVSVGNVGSPVSLVLFILLHYRKDKKNTRVLNSITSDPI